MIENIKFYLSTYLIPVFILTYSFFKYMRPIIIIHCICIFFLGIIDTFSQEFIKIPNSTWKNFIISFFLHFLIIIPILYFNKPNKITNYSHIVFILGILILAFNPFWIYTIDKKNFIFIYIFLYFIFIYLY